MSLKCTALRFATLLVNLLCNVVVPVVEGIAHKFRIGDGPCDCPPSENFPHIEVRSKTRRKKARHNRELEGGGRASAERKRVKLLVDITVRQVGGGDGEEEEQEVEIEERTRFVDERNRKKVEVKQGLFVRIFNFPSSVLLYLTAKVREWAQGLNNFENKSCENCENNRVKKSPKRRISRANYRKIIPFFPFNLLGFSNYSAFQMPSLTNCSSRSAEDATNNLNLSNVSGRVKRRRSSSEQSMSSISENDLSHIELPVTVHEREYPLEADPSSQGHDEVDSDSSEDTVKSSKNQGGSPSKTTPKKKVTMNLANGTKDDHVESDNEDQDLEEAAKRNKRTVMEQLEEVANGEYKSDEDPDYVPEMSESSSSEDSYNTDDISETETYELRQELLESVNSALTNNERISEKEEIATVKTNENPKQVPTSLPIPPNNALEATSEKKQNGHGHGTSEKQGNGKPSSVTGEDDYKTPDEEELNSHLYLMD